MTLRARPVARRRGRAGWDSGDRRNSLINLGFFLAIGVSILLLLGYAAWSWYDDHFGAAATVEGQVITKDDLRSRLGIEGFRLSYLEQRIQTYLALGRISSATAQGQLDLIAQRRNQLASLTLERLVDVSLMDRLANENGVTVSDADVDAAMTEEATVAEQRHAWMIEVEPVPNPKTGQVGDEEKRTALGRAQRALARLKAGESWEDVARTASDSGIAAQAGDLGWLTEDSGYDEKLMRAVFAAQVNAPTDVIEGDDGVYRIGRATEIAPKEIDPDFETKVDDAGIKLADFRTAVRGDVIRKKLSEKVVADMSQPAPQRHVLEIYLPEPNQSTVPEERGAKVRWIVFAPNDSMKDAPDLPSGDPAWDAAKQAADSTYAILKDHPERFDSLARSTSDESTGADNGGKQQWIYPSTPIDLPLKVAVNAEGLEPGQLLEPVRSELGWYLIQFLRGEGDGEKAWLESVKAKITDDASFKQAARDNSETEEAKDGGDLGWVAQAQLKDELDKAAFETAVGSMSDVIVIPGDGAYLLKVLAEETRTPTEEQLKIFKDSGFSYWYTKKKEAANITYDLASSGTG